jgi:hypothetical protein
MYPLVGMRYYAKDNTQASYYEQLRGWAGNRSVIIQHTYAEHLPYLTYDGADYAAYTFEHFGYDYIVDLDILEDNTTYSGETWTIIPCYELLFAAMNQYKVWTATPRQIYDRSLLTDQITFTETDTTVTIVNSSGSTLDRIRIERRLNILFSREGGSELALHS